ncbi:MAG: hypothetical protein K0R31_261 [Clostridiales bacterium]|nr:hypothetical protein [Clostridiales bacterium]
MLKLHNRDTKGSATLESIIVLSAILLILAALIFAFMILYQESVLSKAASLAAQQGAEIWVDSRKNIETGEVRDKEERKDNIYWPIFELGTSSTYNETIDTSSPALKASYENASKNRESDLIEKKYAQIRKVVYTELYRGFLKPENTRLSIDYNNTFIQREIQVTLLQEIKIPLGGIKAFFDGKETVALTGKSTAVVSMPAEYIRNIDLGIEYAYRVRESIDFENMLRKVKGITQK